jgi:hypothetical protein
MKQVTYAVLMAFVIALALAVVLSSTGEVSEVQETKVTLNWKIV